MAKRQKVASAAVAEMLITETSKSLGGDARFLAPHLNVRRRGASRTGMQGSTFSAALLSLKPFGKHANA